MNEYENKEKELFRAFTESDYGLRIFLKQAISISDAMMEKSTTAEDKISWIEMSIAARKLECEVCERIIAENNKTIGILGHQHKDVISATQH